MSTGSDDIACKELVELVTAYLEGALDPTDRRRFEAHLAICDGCSTYVEQIRNVAAGAGEVSPEALEPDMREGLIAAFRDWTRERKP